MEAAELGRGLKARLGRVEPLVYGSLGSTNTELARLAREGAPEYTAVVALEQTAGRGLAGRSFYSPAGVGVYFSLLLRPGFPAVRAAELITPACAVAAAAAAERLTGEPARIKWVNDVYLRGRKVCGILTEAEQGPGGALDWVIAGIGVNLTEPEGGYPEPLAGRAGALYEGAAPDGAALELVSEVLGRLVGLYEQMPGCGFRDEYERRLLLTERPEGTPVGVDEAFRLRVRAPDGTLLSLECP